jgi:hypothetical protein
MDARQAQDQNTDKVALQATVQVAVPVPAMDTRARNRKHRLERLLVGKLTPWKAGLTVAQGDYVNVYAIPYIATNGGVSGAAQPHGYSSSDGVVTWVRVSPASLLKYLFRQAPTP